MRIIEIEGLRLGPLLASVIRDNAEAIGASRRGELQPPELIDLTCTLATACAQRVDPGIQREQVEAVVDTENFLRIFSAAWGVSLPADAPGELKTVVSPST